LKRLCVLAILFSLTGVACSDFSSEEAPFVAVNATSDNIRVGVNAVETFVYAGLSKAFTVTLEVPRSRSTRNFYGPSQVDRVMQVSVTVRNERTGTITLPTTCNAGAKVTTEVTYSLRGGIAELKCKTLVAR